MNNKNKNLLLISAFLLMIVVCYKLAISKTFEQKKQYEKLKKQELLFVNAPKKLSLLRQKQVYYDSLLNKYQIDESSIQNNLLNTINKYALINDLKVINFMEPHITTTNNLIVKTYDFTIEGKYNDINQLIFNLEQKTRFGEIIHTHYEKKKNFRTNKLYLKARILLKSFY